MKDVCRTSLETPALSLIKKICYGYKFRSLATDWGKEKEKTARDVYFRILAKNHDNFEIIDSGMWIDPRYPFIGGSPDGVAKCSCCGVRCLEIKCPFSYRDSTINDMTLNSAGYLYWGLNGEVLLKQNHSYYYQIQTQLLVTGYDACDFFVWTEKDHSLTRVQANIELQNEIISKSKAFFSKILLRELVAKYYTESNKENTNSSICICNMTDTEDDEVIIKCSKKDCKIKLLHQKCMRLRKVPKSKWLCKDCKFKQNSRKKTLSVSKQN